MRIKVRAMEQDDLDEVYSIERVTHIAPWTAQIMRDCVLAGFDCRVLEIREDDGKKHIVGYVICRHTGTTCHILNLCIPESEQRKGYGKRLLESLFNVINKAKIHDYLLEVRVSNAAAIALYKQFGFEEVEIKKAYYDDETKEDALILKKFI